MYNLLLLVSLPGAFVYFLWRILVARRSNESWRDNLGALPKFTDRQRSRKLIWIHASSVGEVVASLPIQEEIRKIIPEAIILVTTMTQTGNAMARKSSKNADAVGYFPLDYPGIVHRALNRVRPDVFVMVETEIWPNFLAAAKRRGVSTVVVTGRISDTNFKRAHIWWRWLLSWGASNIDYFCMQTELDAGRIRGLGVRPERVRVLGNTKFDQDGAQLPYEATKALRADLGLPDGAPVFVAGSTNPGEEEPLLAAFEMIRRSITDLRLIIAPRQIDRAVEIQELVEAKGLSCARRSRRDSIPVGYDVLVLDTFGELAATYAVGELAFVGGTLIPRGGHSIFQPILQGKPVLFGLYTFKTRDMAQMAIAAGVGFEIGNAGQLAEQAVSLLTDGGWRAEIDAACRKLVSENRGASTRCAELVAETLVPRSEAGSGD